MPTTTGVARTASPAPVAPAGATASALVKAGPARLNNGDPAQFTAAIESVQPDDGLTMVTLLLRANRPADPASAFSALGPGNPDLSAIHLIDRRTGQVFLPVSDPRQRGQSVGSSTHPQAAGIAYRYVFLTAALPEDTSTVDVSLAALGTAANVPVTRP